MRGERGDIGTEKLGVKFVPGQPFTFRDFGTVVAFPNVPGRLQMIILPTQTHAHRWSMQCPYPKRHLQADSRCRPISGGV